MSATAELFPVEGEGVRRRNRRDPAPHFKTPQGQQLDVLLGSLEEQGPAQHLAREVASLVGHLDTSAAEGAYSSLSPHGHHPKKLPRV